MYRIDSMYEAMVEAVVKAHQEQKTERWVAAAAFWLGRQQIFGERDFWYGLAAKVTSLLPQEDRTAIEAQLNKQEDAVLDSVGDWPVMSSGLQSVVNSWSPAPIEVNLAVARAEAVSKVDRSAEAYRLNFITAGDGQAMAYQQKLAEARAKVADPSIADNEIPHITAEAEATGMSKAEKAEEIIATFAAWQNISAAIEGKRMATKKAIAEADTAEAINAAANVNWAA